MPKPQYQLKAETINALLEELQRVTNCKLQSHSDSIKIAEILNAAKHQISPHTLSRLCGFFSSATKPYLYNINAIAQFLGYLDVYDFERLSGGELTEESTLSTNESRALLALEMMRTEEFANFYSLINPLSPAHIRLNHIIARPKSDFLFSVQISANRYRFMIYISIYYGRNDCKSDSYEQGRRP
mgnify:CR=1 FL=1